MRDMTSLDLLFAVNELRNLIGGQIQKIYQQGKAVWLDIFVPGKTSFTLRFEPGKIFVTEYRRTAPEQPESFAMFCRKHVQGQRILGVRQHGFDRIIEVETDKAMIFFEIFSKGNVIICDKAGKILMPLEIQIWKDRQILPRKQYAYPPEVVNPFQLTQLDLHERMLKTEKDLVRFLAADLSFSGLYAEEICARAQIDKNKPCKKVGGNELIALYESIHSLIKLFEPQVIKEDSKILDVVPFGMMTYINKQVEKVPTFLHALDEAYTREAISEIDIRKTKAVSEELAKIEHIANEQRAAVEKFEKISEESKVKAEAIGRNFELTENIISALQTARSEGKGWKEIKEMAKKEPAASVVKEIQEKKGKIVLRL